MTTYSGRGASYVPGREIVNKEPPVSRYVVEKLYRVHRERVLKVEKTIDTRIVIPDFLLNREWKKNSEKQKQKVILQENQEIYKRIARLEDEEGHMSKDNKEHIRRMSSKLGYLRKLKEHGRLVNLIKIQKENEYFLKRLEKAKPQYTLKKCKDWYKHHELYKVGRRSDPTAGHIMHGMNNLLPSSLPPLSTVSTKLDDETLTTLLDSKRKRKQLPSLESSSVNQYSIASNSILSQNSTDRRTSLLSKSAPSFTTSETNPVSTRKFSQQHGLPRKESRVLTLIEEAEAEDSPQRHPRKEESGMYPLEYGVSFRSLDGSEDGSEADFSLATIPFNHEVEVPRQQLLHLDDMVLLASRPFPLPTESKNCLVQIYCSRDYDENLRIAVIPAGSSTQDKLAERVITIDHAYDLVHASGHSSQLMHATEQDDLQTLSDFLINMFKEADLDASGSLTFDEFQALMEQVELGISPQELRFVISEADENENGVVDYEEFVPLAVDLIQSFRARNRAKTISSQQDVLVDDQILQTISSTELATASKICLEKLGDYDKKNYGLIRVSEFKRCLSSVAASVGLLESEINLMSQLLPRDQFNRLKYNSTPTSFLEHLTKVRFMTMKNAMIESQGSGLQKYLLELCKDEERKHDEETMKNSRGGDQKTAPPGYIPCRSLINILTNSPRLSLSRLQVLVIMSEASVLDGYINYYQFIPVVTKAIELMFEPKALRQRAELIARTDLSPEALLHGMGMSQDAFEQRLLTLFKSYDIDHNGTLDQNEFIACLESLELQLTKGEMVALMATADVAQHGFLGFEDFVKFFTHNLLHLEREKRIRLLQSSMDEQQGQDGENKSSEENSLNNGSSSNLNNSVPQKDLGQQLLSIFQLSDPNNTGFITYEDFESILNDFSMHSSAFLMDLLRSELHTSTVDTGKMSEDGSPEQIVLVEYGKSLATCADLFSVYRAKESAWVEHHMKEEEAMRKAQQIAQAQVADIQRVCRYLLRRMRVVLPVKMSEYMNSEASVESLESHVHESTVFLLTTASYADLQAVVRSPQAGLSRSEANIVLHRLLGSAFTSTSADTAAGGDANATISSTNDNSSAQPSTRSRTPRHLQHSITDRAVSLSPRLEDGRSPSAAKRRQSAGLSRPPQQTNATTNNNSNSNAVSNGATSQICSRDIFEAVFEARKTTIMRTLLQPIDHSALQVRIYQALEDVWKVDHPIPAEAEAAAAAAAAAEAEALAANSEEAEESDAPRDVYGNVISSPKNRRRTKKPLRSSMSAGMGKYLPVDRCYSALESMTGLPVSRAQLMFVIAAADCYDNKTGSLLDIMKLSEHIGQVFGQLIGAENIATRGAVVAQGHVDDRKALYGLKDTHLLRYLQRQLLGEAAETAADITNPQFDHNNNNNSNNSNSNNAAVCSFTVDQLCQVLRDTQRLQLTDRDLNTILAVCSLSNRPRDELIQLSSRDASERLLATVVDCVVALCRERMIHRRLSLCHNSNTAAGEGSAAVTANGLIHEDSRKTLKALADKLLYVVKLHQTDSVTQEEARRFSGLDTAEYFYPLRVGLPGDSKLMRQNAAMDDASSPLFPANRRHHHHVHRLQSREGGGAGGGNRAHKHSNANTAVAAALVAEDEASSLHSDGNGGNTAATAAGAPLMMSNTATSLDAYYDEDFEDDPEVAVMVLFKGAVFLPARIPLPAVVATTHVPPSSASNTAKTAAAAASAAAGNNATLTRKTSTETLSNSGSGSEQQNVAVAVAADESRPTSSFTRRLQGQVQQASAASSSSAKKTPTYRSVRKPVFLQIVAVDNGGGLSLYSTMGSGLIVQAVSPDGSLVVPSVTLPLRLPSVGAVDKEAAEQFVTNILERMYLEQVLPPSAQQQPPHSQPGTAANKSATTLRTASTAALPIAAASTPTAAAAAAATTTHNNNTTTSATAEPSWTIKLQEDED